MQFLPEGRDFDIEEKVYLSYLIYFTIVCMYIYHILTLVLGPTLGILTTICIPTLGILTEIFQKCQNPHPLPHLPP